MPPALRMDLPISPPDRFRQILRNSAAGAALRVYAQARIARARALCERFSNYYEKRRTEWWSKRDLNWRPHDAVACGGIVRNFGAVFGPKNRQPTGNRCLGFSRI